MRRKQYGLVRYALFIPIYWMLMSIAALMALSQLIFKPHYWEKTIHGLHLRKNQPLSDLMALKENARGLDEAQTVRVQVPGTNGYRNGNGNGNGYRAPGRPQGLAMPYAEERRQQPIGGGGFAGQPPVTPNFYAPAALEKEQSSMMVTVTGALRRVMTLPMPVATPVARIEQQAPLAWWKNPWVFVLILFTANVSLAACQVSLQHGAILLYSEAYSHLRIPLNVLDTHFSLAQFGGVWLPLPHALILPFIWNDFLWHTGLAGSIPSMCCYVISAVFLFQAASRLTKDTLASFAGTLMFALNPNILYLQTTPLSELVCIATLTMAGYFFLVWTQEDQPRYLLLAAASTFLATLTRYDGWILVAMLPVLIVVVGLIRHHRLAQIESNVILFLVLAALGIALWLVWGAVIFGDPVYFLHSQFPAQGQQALLAKTGINQTFHNLFQSLRYYVLACVDVIGPMLLVLAGLGLVMFVSLRRLKPEVIGTLAFLVPFVFYVISLYNGQTTIYMPAVLPAHSHQHLYNVRLGAEMVAPAALFIAVLVSHMHIPPLGKVWGKLGHVTFILVILTQSVLIVSSGIVTLQDGQFGASCEPAHQINIYLAQHYNGGKILEDIFSSNIDGTDAGINYGAFVNENAGPQWMAALKDPTKMDWIIVRPESLRQGSEPHDQVARYIKVDSLSFLTNFSLVVQEDTGLELYHRNGSGPLPTYPIPPGALTAHLLCGKGGS